MTIELKLVHDTTTLSLKQAANSGWRLQSDGWSPRSAPMASMAPVTETLDLIIDATSHDTLATDVQELDHMRFWARQYMVDPTSEHPVWLHAQMQEETGARRALVTGIDLAWSNPLLESDTGRQAENQLTARVTITRMPWWEAPVKTIGDYKAESAAAVLVWEFEASGVFGDVPGRIEALWITNAAAASDVTRLWIGLRSDTKHGTLANFVPIWECEDGVNEADVTDDAATDVNGASPGSGSGVFIKITDDGDPDWDGSAFIPVYSQKLSTVSANESDNFGDFLWILRYKCTQADTWEVQLRWGYEDMDNDDYVRGPIVEISGTDWNFLEMGRQRIPLRNLRAIPLAILPDGYEATYTVQMWARRTVDAEASGLLYLDCLCLVPIDEGWLKSWKFLTAGTAASYWILGIGPMGEQTALAYDAVSELTHIAALATSGFAVPVGIPRAYVVYANTASHDLTEGLHLTGLNYYKRWANLRGAE